MRSRSPFLVLSLAVMLSGCTTGASTALPTGTQAVFAPQLVTATPGQPESPPTSQPDAPTAAALPIATSRGPALEATDPSTVELVSGGLQLVEFFRFT